MVLRVGRVPWYLVAEDVVTGGDLKPPVEGAQRVLMAV